MVRAKSHERGWGEFGQALGLDTRAAMPSSVHGVLTLYAEITCEHAVPGWSP